MRPSARASTPCPAICACRYRISKTIVALQPDTSALPPDRVFRYTPLPRLDRSLYVPVPTHGTQDCIHASSLLGLRRYGRRREVPVIADAPTAVGTDYQRLKRLPWLAAASVGKAAAGGAEANVGAAPIRLSAAENVYMAWFILFSGKRWLALPCYRSYRHSCFRALQHPLTSSARKLVALLEKSSTSSSEQMPWIPCKRSRRRPNAPFL